MRLEQAGQAGLRDKYEAALQDVKDIIDRGIVLTGGGSMLKGLDTRFREETNLPIITVDDPLTSVVLGVGKILDDLDLLPKVAMPQGAHTR